MANHVAYSEILSGNHSDEDDPAFHDSLIIAEGDSWFTLGAVPSTNFIKHLKLGHGTLIINCAKPGDTIKNMSDIRNNDFFTEALSTYKNNDKLKALLFSAGGNDMIDAAISLDPSIAILRRQNSGSQVAARVQDYCNTNNLQKLLANIKHGYSKLARLRDHECPHVPIVAHTYDYPTPRNSKAKFLNLVGLSGPWLYRALRSNNIPERDWLALTDYLFENLHQSIKSLENGSNRIKLFQVVDTLGTLNRPELGEDGETEDWLNEIHPNENGYRKLGRKLTSTLRGVIS